MLMPSLTRLSLWFAALMFPVVASAAPAAPQPELRTVIDQALRTSAQQYEWMLEHLPTQERMPRTLEKGKLVTVRERDWTVGFFPGTLWYLYEGTQRPSWRAAAERFTRLLESEQLNNRTHDVGFILNCSYGNGLRLTGDAAYRPVLLKGAQSLATRFSPVVRSIRSWDRSPQEYTFAVIIDNMMNLELLTWAARNGGESRLRDIAIAHADTTLANHFRPDSSTFHVVDYDTATGRVLRRITHQGTADSSAWARGQAWSLYGYTMMFRETREVRYLETAEKVARFIMNHPRLPADKIPYWDFDAPGQPNAPRDSSAAAIMSSALFELSGLTRDPVAATRYATFAEAQLRSLASPTYLAEPGTNGGFILKHATGNFPKNSEIDGPINYADYYFLEALLRARAFASSSAKPAAAALELGREAGKVSGNYAPLQINLTLPLDKKSVELRFRSARNRTISKITDIAPNHPAPQTVLPSPKPDKEVWYPVVDLDLNAGMNGVLRWETAPRVVAVNHHFHGQVETGKTEMPVSAEILESWENSVYSEPAVALQDFYLAARVPVINGALKYSVASLAETWAGTVTMLDTATGQEVEVLRIEPKPFVSAQIGGAPAIALTTTNLERALMDSVNYLLRAQNRNSASPTAGGLHLFYDLDAQTYRSSHWIWGAGPAVSALLEAEKIPVIARQFSPRFLTNLADEIGRSGLALRILDPKHPAYGVSLSRWRRAIDLPFGYEQCAAVSDALFLSGWSWIPLYQATGNVEYLRATELLAASTARLMKEYELVPQDYYVDRREWSEHTIDESGFGVEGLRALYATTKEPRYKKQADDYMKQHLAKLSRDDGLWERGWNRRTGVMPTIRMTRGLGWAMEGLLAAHETVPEGDYLMRAKRLADSMMKWQRADGSWVFIADQAVERYGISEKGTALWSLLFYRLYRASGEARHLAVARQALSWCVANQYRGSDPQAHGGIVGMTEHSAVGAGHRAWFKVACAYTTGFAALATIEELKIQALDAKTK